MYTTRPVKIIQKLIKNQKIKTTFYRSYVFFGLVLCVDVEE